MLTWLVIGLGVVIIALLLVKRIRMLALIGVSEALRIREAKQCVESIRKLNPTMREILCDAVRIARDDIMLAGEFDPYCVFSGFSAPKNKERVDYMNMTAEERELSSRICKGALYCYAAVQEALKAQPVTETQRATCDIIALAWMVWLHTLRTHNTEELKPTVEEMWNLMSEKTEGDRFFKFEAPWYTRQHANN